MYSGHLGGQWAAGQDVVVHIYWLHSGQEGDTLRCLRCKFICVGRVSDPALRRNGSCPFGRPFMILDQNVVSSSRATILANLLWTCTHRSFLFQLALSLFSASFLMVFCSDLAGRPWSVSWNKS